MAALGTIGASARIGVAASGTPFAGGVLIRSLGSPPIRGVTIGDGYPQPVNPIVQRRGQVVTGDPLLTSD